MSPVFVFVLHRLPPFYSKEVHEFNVKKYLTCFSYSLVASLANDFSLPDNGNVLSSSLIKISSFEVYSTGLLQGTDC